MVAISEDPLLPESRSQCFLSQSNGIPRHWTNRMESTGDYFAVKVNPTVNKPPSDFNGGLTKLGLTILVELAAGGWVLSVFIDTFMHLLVTMGDYILLPFNTSRPEQNGCLFADYIFNCISLIKNGNILLLISLKFVTSSPIGKKLALVKVMVWCCLTTSHCLSKCWLNIHDAIQRH